MARSKNRGTAVYDLAYWRDELKVRAGRTANARKALRDALLDNAVSDAEIAALCDTFLRHDKATMRADAEKRYASSRLLEE